MDKELAIRNLSRTGFLETRGKKYSGENCEGHLQKGKWWSSTAGLEDNSTSMKLAAWSPRP